jgi:RHS repeat-associated protein
VQGAREREARFLDSRVTGNTGGGFKTDGGEGAYRSSAQTIDATLIHYPVNLLLVGDTAGNPLGYLLEPEMEDEAQSLPVLQKITVAKPDFRLYCTDIFGNEARVVTMRDILAIRANNERFYLEAYNADCKPTTIEQSTVLPTNVIDPFFYIYDHLGNTRVVYSPNINGNCLSFGYTFDYAADYSPYGRILRSAGASVERYLSTQHERDVETGYDNRGARLYDSEIGRFINIDPMAGKFAAWSPYNYVMGNPVILIDPDGMAPENIIIGSSEAGIDKRMEYQKGIFIMLQQLTDDKLSVNYQTGQVSISGYGTGTKEVGTNMLRIFIEGFSDTGGKGKCEGPDLKITDNADGDLQWTDEKTRKEVSPNLSANGFTQPDNIAGSNLPKIGSNSTMYILPSVNGSHYISESIKTPTPSYLVLGHEMIHAVRNALGIRTAGGKVDNPKIKNKEEFNVQKASIPLYKENGIDLYVPDN